MADKVTPDHLRRLAYLYVRQSSLHQVHDNRESTARQYALRQRAERLGWSADRIAVIDEDQGLSGASATGRAGFQRMVADVGLGQVGLVMGLEVSRFARSSTDWHRLLEICALSDTLILDEDGVYDPAHFNDRLLLGLKGTMSEAELHVLRARLLGGQLNKARRGELWIRPPIGFVHDPHQGLVLDPDEQVQVAVRSVFDTFARSGSALDVVRHFTRNGILFPRRPASGARAGELEFVPVKHSRVIQILHNPRYAGAFVYGRTRRRKAPLGGKGHEQRMTRDQWKVFLPRAHPGYLTWEQFEANEAKLLSNKAPWMPGPPREGSALLQGLAICGRCGRRMIVSYRSEDRNGCSPSYICRQDGKENAQPGCQIVAGALVDRVVSEAVIEAMAPAELEMAMKVFDEIRSRRAELDRIRRAQVERAREQVELAQRQYMLVRPENRLVADNLERQWNEKLVVLVQAEQEYARAKEADSVELNAEQRREIEALAGDLPRVWSDPRTSCRERKRMIRLLIEDVTLLRDSVVRIQIRWKGGATTSIEKPLPPKPYELFRTPSAVVERVRQLAAEHSDHRSAQILNAEGFASGEGKRFTTQIVWAIRKGYKIESLRVRLRREGWLTTEEMGAKLGVRSPALLRYAKAGRIHAVRPDCCRSVLFRPLREDQPKPQRFKHSLKQPRPYPPLSPRRRGEVQCDA